MINLRKLSEQMKEERALKIERKILKQTHDIKLAESLPSITQRLDEVEESTQRLGDVTKESNTPQAAIENTPQPAKEITPQPIENNEAVLYDVELENTLRNMRDNNGFFKTQHDPQRGWTLNTYPIKMLHGTKVEVDDKEKNITPGFQKVFTDTSYTTAKSMSDTEKLVVRDILQKTDYYKRLPTKAVYQVVIILLKTILIMMS